MASEYPAKYTRLEPELEKRLVDFAADERRSVSFVIREAIVEYLDKRVPVAKKSTPPKTRAPKGASPAGPKR